LWDAASGEVVGRALRTPAGLWLVIAAEGLFDCSPEAQQLAAWRLGNRLFTLGELPASFRHQGLLRELLSGKRLKPKEDLASVLSALAK
jgi:hypothetical protein